MRAHPPLGPSMRLLSGPRLQPLDPPCLSRRTGAISALARKDRNMLRLWLGGAALWVMAAGVTQAAGVLELHGDGVQIYRCVDNKAGVVAWTLEGPDAKLIDTDGKVVGH